MMRYLAMTLAAAGLVTGPVAASAADMPSAAVMGANAFSLWSNYQAGPDRNARILQRLDQICASKRRSDQRDCEHAWRVINKAYAELQAKRAAEAAAAAPAE